MSNGRPYPATPLSVDTPKHVANAAAVVEASAKIQQLTKDLEAAGWEMQTMKQDLGKVRNASRLCRMIFSVLCDCIPKFCEKPGML